MIVGTPGRIIDFIEEQCLSLEKVNTLVLDEADRMFEMGFEEQLKMILSQISPKRHIMMFSATWPKKMAILAREYFSDFIHINVGPEEVSANRNVTQKFEFIPPLQKLSVLDSILKNNPDKKILVFCNTKRNVTEVYHHLKEQGIKCGEVHGDKMQVARENTLDSLKAGHINVVIATDLAARGLDIKNVGIVINFDFPVSIENYVHRIGRTGRAGKTGDSITFFTPMDGQFANELINTMKLSGQTVPDQLNIIARSWANDPYNSSPRNFREKGNNNSASGIGLGKYARYNNNQDRSNYNNQNRSNYNNSNTYGEGNKNNFVDKIKF